MQELAKNIRQVRTAKGWTQAELADASDVVMHQTTIAKIEQGERKVTVEDWLSIAQALDVTPSTLLVGAAEIDWLIAPPVTTIQRELARPLSGESRPRRPIDREVLERVAGTYTRALNAHRPVTKTVAREFSVSSGQASQLIHKARRAGLLPETKPGKKGST